MKRLIATAGMISLIILTGAGCSNGGTTTDTNKSSDGGGAGIKVSNPTDNSKILESYVTKTFGEVKITSFLNDFPVKGATGIEYKVTRTVTQKDVAALEAMLKKNGFEAESGKEDDGTYSVGGANKTHLIVFTPEVGGTKVGGLIMPVPEDFDINEE